MKTISMRQMQVGQEGLIKGVKAEGEMGRRIRDMGLIKGARVMIQGRAPLKDPVAVRMRGFTLSLRNNEADLIDVEVSE